MKDEVLDQESKSFLVLMADQERIRANRLPGVRTVLVVISASGMVFDIESLRQKIMLSYPDAAVFFQTTIGKSLGSVAPGTVDLLLDFTGPGQRQWFLRAKKLRRGARVAVGRNCGLFRKRIYDRVFDEKSRLSTLDRDAMVRERQVQREVLALAGVPLSQMGDTAPDRGRVTPLELPPLRRQ